MFVYLLLLVNFSVIDGFLSHFDDLSFGCRQVEQVICDRPDMGKIISRDPSLRQMLICHFAGASGNGRVYWDCREPDSGRPAEHLGVHFGYPAMVRVAKKCGSSSIDKCAMLVFELLNLQLDNEFDLLATAAVEKRKSREAFAA